MLFASLTFLCLFLPAVWLGSRLLPLRGQNVLLLLASLIFYAWGGPSYLALMLGSITLNWAGGFLIHGCRPGAAARTWALALVLAANIGLLGWFKYYGFFTGILRGLPGLGAIPVREIALPVGISFYTFQAMSYDIDLYRGRIRLQKSWLLLALYISFFPQLIAGPIVQYAQIERQLTQRAADAAAMAYGVKRFCWGLAKKVILANAFAARADEIYGLAPADASTGLAWLGALYYSLQIYYDFSGYSDMAIGLGELFGFHFPENFNYPYLAASITEFWRRWHMTLSGWFRDYLYIPLGGNRRGVPRTCVHLLVVFFVTGLWHGAQWQFVAWGVFYGILLVAERLFFAPLQTKRPLGRAAARIYTLFFVTVGWVLFRAPGLRAAAGWLRAMLLPTAGSGAYPVLRYLDARMALLLCAGLLLCGPAQAALPRLRSALSTRRAPGPAQTAALLAALFWSYVQLICGTYNPFIYFRF